MCGLRGGDDGDGYLGVVHAVLADAAQQGATDRAEAAGAHHQLGHVLGGARLHDLLTRLPTALYYTAWDL